MSRSTKFFHICPSSYVCWNGWHIFSLKYASVSYLQSTFCALRWYVWSSLSFAFFGWFSSPPSSPPFECCKCIACRRFTHSLHKCICVRLCVCVHFIQRKICASFPVDLVLLLRVHPISFHYLPLFCRTFVWSVRVLAYIWYEQIYIFPSGFSWWGSATNGKLENAPSSPILTRTHMQRHRRSRADMFEFCCKSKIMDWLLSKDHLRNKLQTTANIPRK